MMKKILYGSVFCIWYLMSLLPLRVLYILSDGLFYLIYYVVKYRRPLVRKHLFDSFPEKNEAERIKNADEICVLHEGRIVERGTHEDLITKNGYYRKLHDMQQV